MHEWAEKAIKKTEAIVESSGEFLDAGVPIVSKIAKENTIRLIKAIPIPILIYRLGAEADGSLEFELLLTDRRLTFVLMNDGGINYLDVREDGRELHGGFNKVDKAIIKQILDGA